MSSFNGGKTDVFMLLKHSVGQFIFPILVSRQVSVDTALLNLQNGSTDCILVIIYLVENLFFLSSIAALVPNQS